MSHSYHEALPGFDPKQILHDGCEECETRGENIERALSYLDEETFERAWQRAYDWNGSGGNLAISYAEKPLLRALWGVQVHLERRGIPLGQVPRQRYVAHPDDATVSEVQWRVVYCSRLGDSPPETRVALTGASRESVLWMFESLCDREAYPEVIWVRLQRAEWKIMDRWLEPAV